MNGHRDDRLSEDHLDTGMRAAFATTTSAGTLPVGARVGRYRIERLIAAGGMATVYEALQERPRRVVALKMIKPSQLTATGLRRFELEAEILGSLRHPCIAQVYDARSTDDGTPYLAMEFVADSEDLLTHADANGWNTKRRTEVLRHVCDAVHHGHIHGVIHRDLKPENILIDATGSPKLIDYGVARSIDQKGSSRPATQAGEVLGTIWYMSPEQCGPQPDAIDARTDVYSLGVVLCELVTGRLPYRIEKAPLLEAARIIREHEPEVDTALHADLRAILLRCLEKSPERRYESAAALGRDLKRFLAHEPVEARSASSWYVFARTVSRHRGKTAVAVLFLLTILGAASALSVLYGNAEEQRLVAEDRAEQRRHTNYFNSVALAQHAVEVGDGLGHREFVANCDEDLRGWEWRWLAGLIDTSTATLAGHHAQVGALGFSPDGRLLASGNINRAGDPGKLIVRQMATQGIVWQADTVVFDLVFSVDGRRLFVASTDAIEEYDVQSGALLERIAPTDLGCQPRAIAISLDGRLLAAGGLRGRLMIWDTRERQLLHTLDAHDGRIEDIAFDGAGDVLASGAADGWVRLWNPIDGTLVREWQAHQQLVSALAIDHGGERVFTGGRDGLLKLWDARTGTILWSHAQPWVRDVLLDPDGHWLATAGPGGVRMSDPRTGDEMGYLRGHSLPVRRLALDPVDSSRLASSSNDWTVRIWDVPRSLRGVVLFGHERRIRQVAFAPDGKRLVTASSDRTTRIWNVESLRVERTFEHGDTHVRDFDFSPDGSQLYLGRDDGILEKRNIATGEQHDFMRPQAPIHAVVCSPQGDLVAAGGLGEVTLCDTTTGEVRLRLDGLRGEVHALAYAADARRLLTGTSSGELTVWEAATGRREATLQELGPEIRCIAISPDRARVAVGGKAAEEGAYDVGLVRIWSLSTGQLLRERTMNSGTITALAYLADGSRLFTNGLRGKLKIWDSSLEHLAVTLRGGGSMAAMSLARDGQRVAAAGRAGTIHMWLVRCR